MEIDMTVNEMRVMRPFLQNFAVPYHHTFRKRTENLVSTVGCF